MHQYVGGVQTNPVQHKLIKSAQSAQMGLPGQVEQPPQLAVTHCPSLRAWLSVIQNTHALTQRNELSFGVVTFFAFFLASTLQNFHSDEITLENRLWMDAWAQNCSVAAVYLLKCVRLIRPGLPWWDSLITCHWVQMVELPLQPLLVLWTSKMQHKFFIMSLFPFAIVCAEVFVHVHNRLLFCKGKTFFLKWYWTEIKCCYACFYLLAFCAHTWPLSRVNGNQTNTWKVFGSSSSHNSHSDRDKRPPRELCALFIRNRSTSYLVLSHPPAQPLFDLTWSLMSEARTPLFLPTDQFLWGETGNTFLPLLFLRCLRSLFSM